MTAKLLFLSNGVTLRLSTIGGVPQATTVHAPPHSGPVGRTTSYPELETQRDLELAFATISKQVGLTFEWREDAQGENPRD
jgi:hypothetical protein